jgi:hypothetical protein
MAVSPGSGLDVLAVVVDSKRIVVTHSPISHATLVARPICCILQQPRVVKVIVRKNKKIAMIEFDLKKWGK